MDSSSYLKAGRCFVLLAALCAAACASDDGDDDNDATTGGASSGGANTGGSSSGGSPSTGGDPGTGATASGGASTGGGPTAAVSVCDDNSFPPAAASVSDLEDGEATGWDVYVSSPDDGGAITAPASGSLDDPPEVVEDGADGTTQAVHFAGTGWLNYGAGVNFNLEGCKDLSEYTGVSFWAKGSSAPGAEQENPPGLEPNVVNFRVITAGSHAIIEVDGANVGGDCDASKTPNKCFMPPQVDIELTDEWQLFELPFDMLKTPPGANPGSAFDGTNAMLLGWHSSNADFDLYIDEVTFY